MFLTAAAAANAQVVISQVYGGGSNTGAPLRHDFIEIHNKGASGVDISNWSVQYASATGSTWALTTIPTGTTLNPGGYYTIRGAGTNTTLPDTPADLLIGSLNLSATAGKVALVNTNVALTGTCPSGPQIIDFVGYGGTATCFETAPAPAPSNTTSIVRNATNDDTNDNSLDFTTQAPNPRTGGTSAPPAADLVLGTVTGSPNPLVGFPGNVTYSFAGINNLGPNNAANVTVTFTMPTGVSFVSSTLPSSVSGQNVTLTVGTINASASVAPFSVVLSANQAFRAEALMNVSFTAAYAGETTPADNTARIRTEVIAPSDIVTGGVAKDDIAWGWNNVLPIATVKLVRNAVNGTPALIRNGWRNLPFVQSVEFDNAGGVQRNPAGNLIGLNFGTAAAGGAVYLFPTNDLTALSGIQIGAWTDATTFTSGSATSLVSRSRIGGVSVSPDNSRIAFTGSDSGSLYVFNYNPAGPDFLTAGRELAAINATGATVGTRWLDNDTLIVASPGAGTDLRVRVIDDDGVNLNLVNTNLISAPGGGSMFTDVEYLPGVSPLVLVSAGRFASNITTNTLFVFDTSNVNWQVDPPAGTFDYSTTVNTMREIGYASNGDLILGGAGPSTPTVAPLTANTPAMDKIPAATTLGAFANNNASTYFFATNQADTTLNMSVSFNGLAVAAGIGGGGPVGCNRADITDIGDTGAGPDDQLTVDDIIGFINTFGDEIGCPGTPGVACNRADITDIGDTGAGPDGQLTVDDIIAFINAFGDGCPA
jgi:uncharacterized repeat protein (TIGR01451 family)